MNIVVKQEDRDYVEWMVDGKLHTSQPIRGGGASSGAVFDAKVAQGAERVQLYMGRRVVKTHLKTLR